MSELSVFLLGKFKVCCNNQEVNCIQVQKVQELFCYLLLYRKRHHHREQLADVLWVREESENNRKYLRKALWQLQTSLNKISKNLSKQILVIDSDWISVNMGQDIWLDITKIEDAFDLVKGKAGMDLSIEQFNILKDAVQVYQGDLLEGWYQDWCIFDRERLREYHIILINKLMGYCEISNQFDLGIEYGNIILSLDRAHERTHRRMMRLYQMAGYRSEALRQFDRCKVVLMEELDVYPSNKTTRLYNHIVREGFEISNREIMSTNGIHKIKESHFINSLSRLKQNASTQLSYQRRLLQEIQLLENLLKDK
jgi:DNA-binding SARP family transcriptional activator